MKKKLGLVIDILMYAILLAQMLYVFVGNTAHELLGMGFTACLICHVILKRRAIAGMLKNLGRLRGAHLLQCCVTALLVLCVLALMISSMDVSRLLLPQVRILGSPALHRCLATAVLALAVAHGGLHGYNKTRRKKTAAALILLGFAAAVALGLALVPYLNRHYKTVEIDRAQAVSGEKIAFSGGKPLTVYFTRVGNTDFAPEVDAVSGASLMRADGELMGNSQLLADMIADAIGCDAQAITLTGEKYPSAYSATVSVAGRELRDKARPGIAPIEIADYDTVILVYPLWWGTIPMPVASFLESADFAGKTVLLVATQGSSGFGQSTRDVTALIPGAKVIEGVSIYCDDIPAARQTIGEWLKAL